MNTLRDTPEACEALLLDNQVCFALHSTSLLMTKVYKPLLQALGPVSYTHLTLPTTPYV